MAVEHVFDQEDPTNGDGKTIRTGTVWTTVAHIITAVIGSGVLSLAWSTAQLGWIGGPIVLVGFAFVTYVSSSLLSDCYRSPDPVTGSRNRSYASAVRVILGKKHAWMCGLLQYASFYMTSVAYVLTSATCLKAIMKSDCFHKNGHDANCEYGGTIYMWLFGFVQIIMSQIPNLHSLTWVSVTAAIMSFCYATIGFGLGLAKVIENGKIAGSITGVPATSVTNKLWLTFQALGDIAFAYPYALILLEIQDTIKSPPAENKVTKKASAIAISVTSFFYILCGGFGYAAFGNDAPGNLLTGFGFYEPFWLVDFANVCIVIHLMGGYQLYSQPIFAFVEGWLTNKFPDSKFLNSFHELRLPCLPVLRVNLFRVCFRTAYVVTTTLVAILFPYFNQVLGVLGALNLWPLAIYFPVAMYIVQKKVEIWSRKWVLLQLFSGVIMLISLVALVGSVAGIVLAKIE